MNLQELVSVISIETRVPKWAVSLVLRCLSDNMARFIVEQGSVKLRGVGSWGVRVRKATEYSVPTVKGKVQKPSELIVTFEVSKHLTKKVRSMASVEAYGKGDGCAQ